MPTYGVTDDGFTAKPLPAIIDDMVAEAKTQFGADIDLSLTSPLYKFIQVIALEEARLWETAEQFYYAGYVDFADGINLDRVVNLLGIVREAAVASSGSITITGTIGINIPNGTIAMAQNGVRFFTLNAAVIGGGGTVNIPVRASTYGDETNVAANTINALQTHIVGVSTVTNPAPTTGGADAETDAELRERSKAYVNTLGKGTLLSIQNAIKAVPGVQSCHCYEDTDEHTVTCYVTGIVPPSTIVDAAIEDTRPAGIPTSWLNPLDKVIYVTAAIVVNGNAPVDAATLIQTAIKNYILGLDTGQTVVYTKIIDAVYDVEESYSTSWIEDVTISCGIAPGPVGKVNISVAVNEKATTDNAKVIVTVT